MIMLFVAEIVSFLLGGPLMLFLLSFLIIKSNLSHDRLVILFPLLLIFQFLIPLGYLLIAFKKKKIQNLDITNKAERRIPLLITFIAYLGSIMIVYVLGNQILLQLTILIVLLLGINSLVTLFWKVSLHMALSISTALLVNILSHWRFPWLFMFVPVIFWSRLVLKRHSVLQLVVGFVLNATVIFGYMYILGRIR